MVVVVGDEQGRRRSRHGLHLDNLSVCGSVITYVPYIIIFGGHGISELVDFLCPNLNFGGKKLNQNTNINNSSDRQVDHPVKYNHLPQYYKIFRYNSIEGRIFFILGG